LIGIGRLVVLPFTGISALMVLFCRKRLLWSKNWNTNVALESSYNLPP